ncbi:23S rRNA (guanine(745)-N(1))-methyltransferase [compost metagenome]
MAANPGLFRCPLCASPMSLTECKSLICSNQHCFDLAKDGYINLLSRPAGGKYGKELFASRKAVVSSGFFEPVDTYISGLITGRALTANGPHRILDAGCGEGSHLAFIQEFAAARQQQPLLGVGLDLSKEGIVLAARNPNVNTVWCVGDLAHSPFGSGQFHTILSILAPSNYTEFQRLLTSDGRVVKVIPGQNYLQELRGLLYGRLSGQTNSDSEIRERFSETFDITEARRFQYKVSLQSPLLQQLVRMTPLSWAADQAKLRNVLQLSELEISVDLSVLEGRKKPS